MQAISVRGLVKSYGDVQAVKGISFDVPQGSFFAFLGPNGAGKSTTISSICSLLTPDSGTIEIMGKSISDPAVRSSLGIVFQDPALDKKLTVRENLAIKGSLYGLDNLETAVDKAIAEADCVEFADQRYGTLSGGQRRRADIARALVHGPSILILDEPTSGLDPHTRKLLWDEIFKLNKEQGITVLLTTHYMEEAANADDVVIIDHGEIVAHGTPTELKEMFSSDRLTIIPKEADVVEKILSDAGIGFSADKSILTVPLTRTVDAIPVLELVKEHIASFEVRTGSLDDAFVSITGGGDE